MRTSTPTVPDVRRPRSTFELTGTIVAGAICVGWAVLHGLVLRHVIFASLDTMINYAHVWYVSDQLWSGHGVPFRMPVIGHGEAYAFPYGLVPWLTAAVVRPILGDWVVTLWLVAGSVGLMATTLWTFPELRRGWWLVATLVNPAYLTALLIGQLPFLWGASMLMAAVGCWRRQKYWWATALAALAQVTHPAVIMPITAALVLGALAWEPNRRLLLRQYVLSVVPALPAAMLVIRSPVFVESSVAVKAANLITTVAPRSWVFLVPVALFLLVRRGVPRWVAPIAAVALITFGALTWGLLVMSPAAQALSSDVDTHMTVFLDSADFSPGSTYRVLRIADRKAGMYQLIRAGGKLDSEFFPESILIRSWPSPAAYSEVLRQRDVDYVMIWQGFASQYKVNEDRVLEEMAAGTPSDCGGPVVCIVPVSRTPDYSLYRVVRSGPPPAPAST